MRSIIICLALVVLPMHAEDLEAQIAAAMDSAPVAETTGAPVSEPAEVAEVAVEQPPVSIEETQELASWQNLVVLIVTTLGTLAAKWFRTKALAEAQHHRADAAAAERGSKTQVVAMVKEYLWERAASIQELELPGIAAQIASGQLSADKVKDRLRSLGDRLLYDTVDHFNKQDIDIIMMFGTDHVRGWIRSAVDKVSVFEKWPTAQVLIEGGAEAILAVGTKKAGQYYDQLRERVVSGDTDTKATATEKAIVTKIKKGLV